MSGQQHAPAALYPREKTRYPFYRGLGGPQGRFGQAENLVPTEIQSRTVQPVAQSVYPPKFLRTYPLLPARATFPAHHIHVDLIIRKKNCEH